MELLKGHKYLCIKSVIIGGTGKRSEIAMSVGKIYEPHPDDCNYGTCRALKNNWGEKHYVCEESFFTEHFIDVTDDEIFELGFYC